MNILAIFSHIKLDTSSTLQLLQTRSSVVVEYNVVQEYGPYLGESASLTQRMVQPPMRFNPNLVKTTLPMFKNLRERTQELIFRLKMAIVPPALNELHDMFRKVLDLQMEGYNLVIQGLENGDASQMPKIINIFDESHRTLLLFERMQRSVGRK